MTRFLLPLITLVAFAAHINGQAPVKIDAVAVMQATLTQLTKGDYDAIVANFDDKIRAAMPADKLRGTWEGMQQQFGAIKEVSKPRVVSKGDYQVAIANVQFERVTLEMQTVVDKAGKIAGLVFRPLSTAANFTDASYVTPASFSEANVTVDAGGWPLPGTLTMPNGKGPFPAVVLVHGSGPHDRDETIGPNRPFRDLGRGLASRGIAVLRYEKRSRAHAKRAASVPDITVKEEVVDDAVAAVQLLHKDERIDRSRVFVLGHSLGGTVAPRIARQAPDQVAGLILMAGAVRPVHELMIDQIRYLAKSDGTISAEEEQQIANFEKFAAEMKTLKPGAPPPRAPGINAPTSYWLDLRDYNPAADAAKLKLPMLILHGGRDYQVTAAELDLWKAALGKRPDVTFKVYPALNHLFIAGSGPSVPNEYFRAGHVDEQVIRDVADWVIRGGR